MKHFTAQMYKRYLDMLWKLAQLVYWNIKRVQTWELMRYDAGLLGGGKCGVVDVMLKNVDLII